MARSALPLLLSFSLLAGCVQIPTDEANCCLTPTPSLEMTAQNALDTLGFQVGDFPSKNWWEMFHDPQLDHLICLALEENPTLQKVQARLEGAKEEAKVKRSYLFPTIGFDANVNWQRLSPTGFFRAFAPNIPAQVTEYELGFNFFYEFDFWGKNRNLYEAQLGVARAQLAEKEQATLILTTSVALTYYQLQALLQQLELLKEEREINQKLLTLTKLRQDYALDTTTQKISRQEALLLINKTILAAEQMIYLTKNQLKTLLGQGPEQGEEIENLGVIPSFSFPLPENLSSNLLARRPDLMAHIWQVEAMAHLVGAAKADFYPNINLTALAGLDSIFLRKLFHWESRAASVQPALYLPIFTAGRIKANLREKEAHFHEAIYAYNEALLHAVKEVADQIVVLKIADQTLQVEEQLVQNKLQNQQIIHLRYKNATNTLLQSLESQEELIQEKSKKIEAAYNRSRATIALIKALGGGYCSPDQPLDPGA